MMDKICNFFDEFVERFDAEDGQRECRQGIRLWVLLAAVGFVLVHVTVAGTLQGWGRVSGGVGQGWVDHGWGSVLTFSFVRDCTCFVTIQIIYMQANT